MAHLLQSRYLRTTSEAEDVLTLVQPRDAYARPQIMTFDHVHPPPDRVLVPPPRTAILYASLASPNFRELHDYLLSLANKPDPHVEYVFRHIPPRNRDPAVRNYLSGYGVSLDIKKMEYLAVDDRNVHQPGNS